MVDPASRLTNAQRELVEASIGVVKQLARGLSKLHGLNEDDALSVGRLALTECVLRYDPDAGIPLSVFAFQRVRGEILDQAGKDRRLSKLARLAPLVSEEVVEGPHPMEHDDERVANDLAQLTNALAASIALSSSLRPPEPEEALHDAQSSQRIREALERATGELEPADQELIRLHYQHGHSLKDLVASGHGTYRTLRRRHQRALVTLHEKLKESGVDSDDAIRAIEGQ